MPTEDAIELINRQILERRAARAVAVANPPAPAEGQQPTGAGRPAVDLSGMAKNEFRAGMPPLSAADVADWITTYRAGYSRFALDPNGEEIVKGMETRLAEALARDGVKLAPLSYAERLKALRIAAAVRGNGL